MEPKMREIHTLNPKKLKTSKEDYENREIMNNVSKSQLCISRLLEVALLILSLLGSQAVHGV